MLLGVESMLLSTTNEISHPDTSKLEAMIDIIPHIGRISQIHSCLLLPLLVTTQADDGATLTTNCLPTAALVPSATVSVYHYC
jgi:hypothetical protein